MSTNENDSCWFNLPSSYLGVAALRSSLHDCLNTFNGPIKKYFWKILPHQGRAVGTWDEVNAARSYFSQFVYKFVSTFLQPPWRSSLSVFACVMLCAYLLWCAYITFYHCLFVLLTTTSLMLFSICLCLCRAICLPALLSLCDFLPLSICIAIFTCLYLSQFVLQNVSITSSQCVFACIVIYICLYHLVCIAVFTWLCAFDCIAGFTCLYFLDYYILSICLYYLYCGLSKYIFYLPTYISVLPTYISVSTYLPTSQSLPTYVSRLSSAIIVP